MISYLNLEYEVEQHFYLVNKNCDVNIYLHSSQSTEERMRVLKPAEKVRLE